MRLRPLTSIALPLAVVALGLSACGGESGAGDTGQASVPGGADPTAVRVIDEWAKALDRGDIDGAARYFAIPSSAENGAIVQIQSREDARRFNSSLPCGARLVKALPHAGYTIATFRLTERPGPGRCGAGTGGKAATAFFIKDGHIADWQRVPSPQERKGGGAPAAQSSA